MLESSSWVQWKPQAPTLPVLYRKSLISDRMMIMDKIKYQACQSLIHPSAWGVAEIAIYLVIHVMRRLCLTTGISMSLVLMRALHAG